MKFESHCHFYCWIEGWLCNKDIIFWGWGREVQEKTIYFVVCWALFVCGSFDQSPCLMLYIHSIFTRLAQDLRETKAAITIQRYYRGYVCYKRFVSIRKAVVTIQCYTRGLFARRLRMELLYLAKAKIIQRCWQRYRARKRYRNYKKTIIYLQSCVRRMIARRELKQLKVGHRSILSTLNWYL